VNLKILIFEVSFESPLVHSVLWISSDRLGLLSFLALRSQSQGHNLCTCLTAMIC